MAYRLIGANPIQPTGFLNTTLPNRPSQYGNEFNAARAAWSQGSGPGVGTKDGLGRLTNWGNQINNYNQNLAGAIRSAGQEAPNYIMPNSVQNDRDMYAAGGAPTLNHALARGQMGEAGGNKWVAQPTDHVFSQFGGKIPLQADYNTALKDAQLIKHSNVGGPLGGLLGVAGFGLGLPGGLLSQFVGGLPAGLQTAAKIGGIGSKLYGIVNSKGRNAASGILGALQPTLPSHPGIR